MNSVPLPSVTVIIPTLATLARREQLFRAIRSAVEQADVAVRVLVVVNGNGAEPEILEALAYLERVSVVHVPEPGVAGARLVGRENVQTVYFSFLDDDDEYLQGTLRDRVNILVQGQGAIFSVCHGWRGVGENRTMSAANVGAAQGSPYLELERNNWLTSCGGLFVTERVPSRVFSDLPKYHEWTVLAYRLCCLGRFVALEVPGYVVHDTLGSLSKSKEYHLSAASALRAALRLQLPSDGRRSLKRRIAAAEHERADIFMRDGSLYEALVSHVRSLVLPGGWKYWSFTFRLIRIAYRGGRAKDFP